MGLDSIRFLESLTERQARAYTSTIDDLQVAKFTGNHGASKDAMDRLTEVVRETMGVAEVMGAVVTLQKASGVIASERESFRGSRDLVQFRDKTVQTLLPGTTFEEALQEMVSRVPQTLTDAAERTASKIAYLYGQDRPIAFAKSAEQAVTIRVQRVIAEAMKTGELESDAARRIVSEVDKVRDLTGAWSESYARMAFRTNVNTAVTAGRFRQVRDPDVRAVIPAMRFDAVGDGDTRHNHLAANGLIFRTDSQVWNTIAPPLGYNCRCSASLVSRPILRRLGRLAPNGSVREDTLPSGAGPDENFRHGGRPDLMIESVA